MTSTFPTAEFCLMPETIEEQIHSLGFVAKSLVDSGKLTLHQQLRIQMASTRLAEILSLLVEKYLVED